MKLIWFFLLFLLLNTSAKCQIQDTTGFSQDKIEDNLIESILVDVQSSVDSLPKRVRLVSDNINSTVSQPSLYNDISLNSYEVFSANLSFSEEDNLQKIVFAPFKAFQNYKNNDQSFSNVLLNNVLFNLSQKTSITTLGIGTSFNTASPYSKKSLKILDSVYKQKLPTPETRRDDESFESYKIRVLDPYKRNTLSAYLRKYDSLRHLTVNQVNFGYNIQLFPVLYNSGSSRDKNYDSLNHFTTKAHNILLGYTHSRNSGDFTFTFNYNLIWSRDSAAFGNNLEYFHGPVVAVRKRIATLIKYSDLKDLDIFIEKHFIPSIYFGFAFESKILNLNTSFPGEKIENLYVFTPYVEFSVTEKAQFRLAVPIQRADLEEVEEDPNTTAGILLQYIFSIVNLN